MRLNAFSPPQYGSSFNAEYPPASTQREGGKQRIQPYRPPKKYIQAGQEEASILKLIKARGYFKPGRLGSLGEIKNYNPDVGKFQVNGLTFKIPTTKNELNLIRATLGIESLGKIKNYNLEVGTFQVNGNTYKIPTTKNELRQIKAALRKIEEESQRVIQGVARELSVLV